MRCVTFLICTNLGLVFAGERPNGTPDDAKALQGSWSIVSVEIEGKPVAMEKLKEARLSVSNNRYSFTLGETRLELRFKVDAHKRPKTIDLQVMDGADQGKIYRGIYTLDADTYKICRAVLPDKARPREFATRPQSGLMIVTWKRDKKNQGE